MTLQVGAIKLSTGVINYVLYKKARASVTISHFHPSIVYVGTDGSHQGAVTLGIMTLSIMTLSIMTLSIMTLSIMTLSIMTLSIMTLTSITINKSRQAAQRHSA